MITEQINEILEMPEGWLEYADYKRGEKYDSEKLNWLKNMLIRHNTVIKPKIYPVEPNDIDVEWNDGNNDFKLEIKMKDHTGYFYWVNFNTEIRGEKVLNLDEKESWNFITSVINKGKQ